MKKVRRMLIVIVIIVVVMLFTYMIRYQWKGFSIHTILDLENKDVLMLERELSSYVDTVQRRALVELSLQEVEYSENRISAVYSNLKRKYVLTVCYEPDQQRLEFFINRTTKLCAPEINTAEWNYDIHAFEAELGQITYYKVHDSGNKDYLYFIIDRHGFYGDPIEGKYISHEDAAAANTKDVEMDWRNLTGN